MFFIFIWTVFTFGTSASESESVPMQCGQVPQGTLPKIVNGTIEDHGAYPFMVNLKMKFTHICGACIYDRRHVLTAAHCVDDFTEEQYKDLNLVFGDWSMANSDSGQLRYTVKRVFIHPEFNVHRWMDKDVAILKTWKAIQWSDFIQPICPPSSEAEGGQDAWAMGWGLTEGTGSRDKLRSVLAPIISYERCTQQGWHGSLSVSNETMICAGYEQGEKDACAGDSGGPLVQMKNARYEVAGLVSWGQGCADPHKPGVYTRLTAVADWIRSITGSLIY